MRGSVIDGGFLLPEWKRQDAISGLGARRRGCGLRDSVAINLCCTSSTFPVSGCTKCSCRHAGQVTAVFRVDDLFFRVMPRFVAGNRACAPGAR